MSTTTTPGASNDESLHLISLITICIFGYVGRAIGEKLSSCIANSCCKSHCKSTEKEFLDALIIGTKDGQSGVTLAAIEGRSMTWTEAAKRLQLNYCAAMTVSILRLIFFHWSQPIGYGVALYIYYSQLPQVQLILGCVVLFREFLYLILTITAISVNPAYLLVDSTATFQSSGWNLLLYIVCPEKFVYFCLGINTNIPLFILVLCDLSGIAALITAINSGVTPVPLMIGYGITTLGGIAAVIIIVMLPMVKACGYEPSTKLIMMSIVNGTSKHKRLDLSASPSIIDVTGVLGALKRNTYLEYLNLRNVDVFVKTGCGNGNDVNGSGSGGSGGNSKNNVDVENNGKQGNDGGEKWWNDEANRCIEILRDSLISNTTLIELDMDWTLLGTDAISKLYLTNHPSLPSMLSLRDCKLTVADAFRLSNAVRLSTTLQVLDLANNQLGNEGCAAIASAVASSVSLHGLDLSNNNIKDRGVQALSIAIKQNASLKWLFIYENDNITENAEFELISNAASKPELAIGIREINEQNNAQSSRGNRGTSYGNSYGTQTTSNVRVTIYNDETKKREHRNQGINGGINEHSNGMDQTVNSTSGSPKLHHPNTYPIQLKGQHRRNFSTLELTWEIQLQQLMALAPCTAKELKLILERSFIYTKLNFVGANKYKKLKKNAQRVLRHFQNLIGSRPTGGRSNATNNKMNKRRKMQSILINQQASGSAHDLLNLAADQEIQRRKKFKALLKRLCNGKKQDMTQLPSYQVENKMLLSMKSSQALLSAKSNRVF